MVVDKLADTLTKLRLSSPSPSLTDDQAFRLIIYAAENTRIGHDFRVYLNPRDMVMNKLFAGNFIELSSMVLPVWPNASVPIRRIRISSSVARILGFSDERSVVFRSWNGPMPTPRVAIVKIFRCNVDKKEIILLKQIIRELPCLQMNIVYSASISNWLYPVEFRFLEINPAEKNIYGPCSKSTSILVDLEDNEGENNSPSETELFIGGLEEEIRAISEVISLSLEHSKIMSRLKIKPPRGILLYGPPGTGKTSLVRIISSRTKLKLITITGREMISSRYYGEAETSIRNIFKEAEISGNCLIFIDEIDSLCPCRDKVSSGSDSRMVATLLTLLDGLGTSKGLFCIAATNSPNSIDNALRRPGRFDKEIEIGVPKFPQRIEILSRLLQNNSRIRHSCIESIAEKAHGFVGADLALIVKEANLMVLQRDVDQEITEFDLLEAFSKVKPSATREILLEIPKVHWNDIGGQGETKQKLKESIELPLKNPGIFVKFGIQPPKGILLYGPPGCSKTMIAKAIATESGLNFFAIKGPEIFSKWVGDSEKAISEIFRKARMAAPSVIFFDEFDAIGRKRTEESSTGTSVSDRVLSQLLSEMDGIDPLVNVTVLAATNRPDTIDSALMRPGRFDRHIYVSLPDFEARLEILCICSRKMPFDPTLDLDSLAANTKRYSGAEMTALCQEAAMQALSEDLTCSKITNAHFRKALTIITPRTSLEMIEFFETYNARY